MTPIPEHLQSFARELAALATKYELRFVDGKFQGGDWPNDIHFQWKFGRHGSDAFHIGLYSTQTVVVKMTASSQREGTAPMCGFCRLVPCICVSAPNR